MDSAVPQDDAAQALPRESYFDSAGVPIRCVEQGAGAPIVLVHSYTGTFDSQFVRTGFAAAVAQQYRVIGFDLRGHGRSGKPHDARHYGREMALDVVRLLDHLGLARAHVLGYSLGAHIVAQLLTLHPQRFATAILAGGTGRRRWSAVDDERVALEAAEIEQGLLRAQLLRLWPPGRALPSEAQLRERSAKYLDGNDPKALAAIRRSNRDQVITNAHLAGLELPLLGIVGSRDPYLDDFRELQSIVPHMRLAVIEGATHNTAAAHPEFLRAVMQFLGAHSSMT